MRRINLSLTLPLLLLSSLVYLVYISIKFLAFFDISERPINELPPLPYKTHLISYIDNDPISEFNQNALVYSALPYNLNSVHNFQISDLEASQTGIIWAREPLIIQKMLNSTPDNELIIYVDTNAMIKSDILPLLKLADQHEVVLAKQGPDLSLYSVVLPEALRCNVSNCLTTANIKTGFGIYKNTPEVRRFVQEWVELATDPSTNEFFQQDTEINSSHLLSLVKLRYNFKHTLISSEEFNSYLYVHNRKMQSNNHDYSLAASLLNQQGKLTDLELAIYNSNILAKLRQWLIPKYPLLQTLRSFMGLAPQKHKDPDYKGIVANHMQQYQ